MASIVFFVHLFVKEFCLLGFVPQPNLQWNGCIFF